MATTSSHPQDYPPSVNHSSKFLSASEAASILSTFLEATRKAPHLHPDALLFSEGVKHGPKSGPSGGIAIHHLRRIEAGMLGENLEAESKEELRAQFGEEAVPLELRSNLPGAGQDAGLVAGDDTKLDGLIKEKEAMRKKERHEPKEEDEKARRKREKKERKEREKANKRKLENDRDDTTRSAGKADSAAADKPRKKAKKSRESEAAPTHGEAEPSNKKAKKENTSNEQEATATIDGLPVKKEDVQSQRDYELSQRPIEGEVGERDGAPKVKQNGVSPVVVKHDSKGNIKVPNTPMTDVEKAERKAAKKARKKEDRKAKGD